MKRFLPIATSVLALACSPGDSQPGGDAAAEASPADDAATDAAAKDATSDAAIESSPGDDSGTSGASPPAGYARCGHATFTQAEAAAACATQGNAFLEQNLPPRHCDAVTIVKGTWEVWCGNGPVYVWVSLEGITATGKYSGCNGSNEATAGNGWLELDGTSGTGLAGPPLIATFDDKTPLDATWASLGNTASDPSGTGDAFIEVTLPGECNQIGPQAVVSGASIAWNAADGG